MSEEDIADELYMDMFMTEDDGGVCSMTRSQTKKCAIIAVDSELSNLARIQESFGMNNIEAIRIITKEVKTLMRIRKILESK